MFVARLEDILEIYARPYDPKVVYLTIDEKGKELRREGRAGLPMQPGEVERYDYEYVRGGSCNLFVAYNIHTGQRQVFVTERRRAEDWGEFLSKLALEHYPEAERLVIVCDNLNIHNTAGLYQVYEPALARAIASRLEFHYTPTHASWLNMTEIELSVLEKQCLGRRMGHIEEVRREVAAWEGRRNQQAARIKWQFDLPQARLKLAKAYPVPLKGGEAAGLTAASPLVRAAGELAQTG